MKKAQNSKGKLLIVKFPLESAWGGEEEIHLLLAKELRTKNYEIGLLTSCPHLSKAFIEQNFYTKKLIYFPDPVSKKSLIIFPITAIYFFFLGLFFLGFFRAKGYKKVLFLRLGEKIIWTPLAKLFGFQVFWGEHIEFGKWMHKNPLLPLWKFWSKKAVFVTPSNTLKKQINKLTNAPVQVLPNALAPSKDLSSKKPSKQALIQFLNKKFIQKFKNTDIFIGYAGRLSREKGLEMLIEIAEKVVNKNKNVYFVLAGGGSEKEKLMRMIKGRDLENKIYLLGFLEKQQLADFYLGLDIFCLFSDTESFGISLLDAMSARLPLVGRNRGAIPEVIQENKTGLIIETKQEAVEAIEKLIKNPKLREKMAKNSRSFYKKHFTAKVFADNAEKIFFLNK